MKKSLFLAAALVFGGCASVQDRVLVNVNQANGTPVSPELAARYPTLESFIHAALDNKSPAGQPKRPLSEPVLWHAITHEDASSVSRYAKKPRLDLEVYCKAHGGAFSATPSQTLIRGVPPESPLLTGFRAQAFAYSKGASEAVARDAFANAYQEQLARSARGSGGFDVENRIIREGYVGFFECRGDTPASSWVASIDISGARLDGSSKYILMRVQSRK